MCTPWQKSAFLAELGENYPEADRPIVFHKVLFNEQQQFDAASGTFICSIPGLYYFGYNLEANLNAHVLLIKNGTEVIGSHQKIAGAFKRFSGNMMLKLDKGERVWLEAKPDNNGITQKSYFMGHLLFEL